MRGHAAIVRHGDLLLSLRATEEADYESAIEALTDHVRYGKTISADTSSKIQAAMDHLNSASESHQNAVKALKVLVELGMADGDVVPDEGQRPTDGMDKKGNVARGWGSDPDVEFFRSGPRLSHRDPNSFFRA